MSISFGSCFCFGVEDSFVLLVSQMADPKWDKHLRPQQVEVAEMLSPRRNRLIARLGSKGLINVDEEDSFINSNKPETDLAQDILRVLRRQAKGSFDKFCDVLLEVKDDTLNAVEKSLRPHRQTSIESKHLSRKPVCLCRGSRDDGFVL